MAKRTREPQPRFRNYIRRQPLEPYGPVTNDKHITYGANDNFPLKLSKLVYDSPAASSCINVIADFIEGDGFSVESIGDKIVNAQQQTLSEVHHMVSESLAMYEGLALNVKYSPEGKITQMYFVPFENCRLGLPDDKGVITEIRYNSYFGTDQYNQAKTIIYDTFNPDPAVVMTQMNTRGKDYRGQILYWGSTRALSRFYPQPSYYSAKNWMEVDARIGEYHVNNLRNGFLQSVLMKIIGNPNAPAMEPSETEFDSTNEKQQPVKTQGEEFNDMMSENFSGTDRANNVMVLWANNKEEFPEIAPFPTSANAQILDTLQNLTTKNITIATKVPAILANIHEGVSLGGDGNTIKAAVKLMQQRAGKWQAILERLYKNIFDHWVNPVAEDIEIVDHQPFSEEQAVDPLVWAELNPETKKKYIKENTNIEIVEQQQVQTDEPAPAQDEDTLKAQAALRGSVGGVQGVLQIQQGVVDGTTTISSALAILTIIFGFKRNEALKLLGQPEENQPAPVNVLYNSYPENARKNAQKAIKWAEQNPGQCGTKMGWENAKAIAEGKPLSYKMIKRIKNYLRNTEPHMNKPFSESCETVLFHAWGGKDMLEWAKTKVKEVEE